jgi:outer membrane protein
MKKIFLFILATSLIFNYSESVAQKKYNINDCINIAIANNYDLLFTKYQGHYDSVLQKSAFGAYLPTLGASASYSRMITNTDNVINLNQLSFGLQANMLIYDGGKREANYRNANNNSKLTELQKRYLTEQIKLRVYTQFLNIIRLEEISKAREEDIKASKNQLDNFKAKYDAGVVSVEVVLSQEAEVGNKEIALLQQQIEVNNAKQSLLITLGEDPSNQVNFEDNSISADITDDNINNFKSNIGGLQSSINSALKNRIDYSTSQLNRDIASDNLNVATGNYYPTLSANLNYGYDGWTKFENNNFGGSFGLNLNIPIFNNYSTDLQVEQSTLAFEGKNTDLLKLEQNIKAEVQTAYFNLESAEKAIQISQKSYTAAKQNFEAIKEKLNVGTATMTDFIMANTQFITAQINIITSSYNYLATQKDLLFTIGKY